MGRTGLEHSAKTPGNIGLSKSGGAESGAVGDKIDQIDSNLRHIIVAWPALPEHLRKAILAIVEAAKSDR